MLDGILNNRKEWNAKKEEYEAKLKALEEEKAEKSAAAASKGAVILWNNDKTMSCIRSAAVCAIACHYVTPNVRATKILTLLFNDFVQQLLQTTPAAEARAPRRVQCAETSNITAGQVILRKGKGIKCNKVRKKEPC